MKKLIVIIAIMLVYFNSYSQSWNGISISGSFTTIKNSLVSKGFTLVTKEKNSAFFSGKINGVEYEVLVFCTPVSNEVCRLVVFFPKRNNWYTIKSEYISVKDMMTDKYGTGESYSYFDSPYYEGDGYEMSALESEKCHFGSFWIDIEGEPNLSISAEISHYRQIKISYENKLNMKKYKDETGNLNKKVF